MTAELTARKRRALELLASGATTSLVCAEVKCKRHKIRYWKTTDPKFREEWNAVMTRLGRIPGG